MTFTPFSVIVPIVDSTPGPPARTPYWVWVIVTFTGGVPELVI